MHFALRACFLFFGGLLVTSASITLGMFYDLWGHLSLVNSSMFWERMKIFPAFQVVTISTMLGMLYPSSFYGMRALNNLANQPPTWGDGAEFSVFLEMSLLVLPLMLIFPLDEAKLRHVFMSRDAYILPFLLLWWSLGAINAYHVKLMKRREQE